MRKQNSGYTLLELAVGMVVLGVITIAVVYFGKFANQRVEQIAVPQILKIADDAIVGFIAAKHRLPCPDTNSDGLENCGSDLVGKLPYKTLGLARADMTSIRYGAFVKKDAVAANDIDLTDAKDRFAPLLTNIPVGPGIAPMAVSTVLNEVNGIDFCHALRLGNALPRNRTGATAADVTAIEENLHIRNAAGLTLKNVAYALSLPSNSSDPATNINNITNAFAAPNNPIASGSQDTVIAMDFAQISDRLSCSGVLASASHSHPNVASAAAIMRGAMLDYKVQLDLELEMAELGVLSAGVGVAGAIGATTGAASEVLTAVSETISSFGGMSAAIGIAAVATALSVAATVVAGLGLDSAMTTRDQAQDRVNEFSGNHATSKKIMEESGTLANAIRAHAIASDAAGIYR
ncbi:type II secretion system protein [Undibacterium fentianense]|uniref:Type II secretion system protein n=1 Tax=Undibacterium fentianense TaxID=2828728 RepID=A0A941E4M5_9BURK|nr:prepilin-type N-terminal cleavage/methylation domain-containing protein [Undibacterium fentianense]MBR7800861.1 type II secretion system protein [Undibacterium fentianense]